ncbi:response regulator transcription factor [Nitrosospira sp. Nsp1]|uniref:response regulator transcription factor n=1 Tax=Nitrosospira sp. Nsp1 TaxID=136547 RepID=UPI00088969D0|nr:response regulator transcription factor [Nitrosospira sp. Nsp1]SCX44272.1 two component transcriptional regulator, LuxR family [Nitrosospira sp. Nsp1]
MSALKARVMLVDDHAMLRHGMAMLINLEPDMEVSGEAGDGEEALAALKAGHHADIVLMDVSLKTLSGFEVIKSIHISMPALPVLVVSMHDEGVYAERALRAGARGYVMKQEPGEVLITAIREVLKGNIYLSKPMYARLLNRVVTGNSESEPLVNSLTPSEFEVLHLIGSGHSSQEIARLLSRSIKTIETHRFHIRTKLNLKDGADLIRYATHWISEPQ